MASFTIRGLDPSLARQVRTSRRSPGYGHPVAAEIATGTGPCRSCLREFEVGRDERLLFTYRPNSGAAAIGSPGPVFIHAEECERFEGPTFPPGLFRLPLLIEGRTDDGRILRLEVAQGTMAGEVVEAVLQDERADFVFIRHAEAGCHIARANRVRAPVAT